MRRAVVVACLVVAGCLAGCANSHGNVYGTVTGRLQTCGGVAAGPRGVPGTVILTAESGRVFTASADGSGNFSTKVPAGKYLAKGHSPDALSESAGVMTQMVGADNSPVVVKTGGKLTGIDICIQIR